MTARNQPRTPKRNYDSRRWREETRIKLIRHHGGKCLNCGVEFNGNNAAIFYFHHTDPATKTKKWNNNQGLATRMEESKGCLILCANCHRLVHSGKLDPSSLSLSLSRTGTGYIILYNIRLVSGGAQ